MKKDDGPKGAAAVVCTPFTHEQEKYIRELVREEVHDALRELRFSVVTRGIRSSDL